jgi:hypothetical protein
VTAYVRVSSEEFFSEADLPFPLFEKDKLSTSLKPCRFRTVQREGIQRSHVGTHVRNATHSCRRNRVVRSRNIERARVRVRIDPDRPNQQVSRGCIDLAISLAAFWHHVEVALVGASEARKLIGPARSRRARQSLVVAGAKDAGRHRRQFRGVAVCPRVLARRIARLILFWEALVRTQHVVPLEGSAARDSWRSAAGGGRIGGLKEYRR